jgi:alpha-tubulin suppressor-like RCC1 family protein
LTHDGKVYGWGFTSNGQLGIGICEDSFEPGQGMARCRILEPRLIETYSSRIINIQCGKTFSTFITEKHEVKI